MNQGQNPRPVPRVRKAPPAWTMEQESSPEETAAPVQKQNWQAPSRAPEKPEVIATNTAVRLTCTICAMMGLFGIFMCWAEKESRAIRHFAVQSAGLTMVHCLSALLLVLVSTLLSGVPYLGFMVSLSSWLAYIIILVLLVIIRIRMMLHAWEGITFTTPLLGRYMEKFY